MDFRSEAHSYLGHHPVVEQVETSEPELFAEEVESQVLVGLLEALAP